MMQCPSMPAVMCVTTNQYQLLLSKQLVMSGTFYYMPDRHCLYSGLNCVSQLVAEVTDFSSWNRTAGTFAVNKKTGEIRLAASRLQKDDIVILPPSDGDMEADSINLYKHLVNINTLEAFLKERHWDVDYFHKVGQPPCTDIAIVRSADGKSATIQWTDPVDDPETYSYWRDTVIVREPDYVPNEIDRHFCVFTSIPIDEDHERTYERDHYSIASGNYLEDSYLNQYKTYIYRFFTFDQDGVLSYEPNNIVVLPINYKQAEEMREARLKQGGKL